MGREVRRQGSGKQNADHSGQVGRRGSTGSGGPKRRSATPPDLIIEKTPCSVQLSGKTKLKGFLPQKLH